MPRLHHHPIPTRPPLRGAKDASGNSVTSKRRKALGNSRVGRVHWMGTKRPKVKGTKHPKILKNWKFAQQSIWYKKNVWKTHLSTLTCGGRKNVDLDNENRMKLSWTPLIRHCSQRKRCLAVFLFHVTLSWHTLRLQTVLRFPTISAKVFYNTRDLEH